MPSEGCFTSDNSIQSVTEWTTVCKCHIKYDGFLTYFLWQDLERTVSIVTQKFTIETDSNDTS